MEVTSTRGSGWIDEGARASAGRLHAGMVALPVAVDGPRHLVEQVTSWVESHLGWQVTDGADLPASVRLVGVGASESAVPDVFPDRVPGVVPEVPSDDAAGIPVVVLVGPDDDPLAATRLAAAGTDAVLGWPGDHDRLAEVVATVLDHDARPPVELLRVGGGAGGVGTTTVALAVGGLVAWSGTRCLVVARGDVPVPGARCVGPEVLAGHRAWAAAADAEATPGLRVVAVDQPVPSVSVPPDVRVVQDCGVTGDVDVLVVRRDRVGRRAIEQSGAGLVVVAGAGPRGLDELVRAAAGRAVASVPWSMRVARAHDRRRVPDALPGSYLAPLRDLGVHVGG